MLVSHYAELRLLHIGCVALSGALFTVRGLLRIGDRAVPLLLLYGNAQWRGVLAVDR